ACSLGPIARRSDPRWDYRRPTCRRSRAVAHSSRNRRGRSHRLSGPSSCELPSTAREQRTRRSRLRACHACNSFGSPHNTLISDAPGPPSRRAPWTCREPMKREILINANPRETRVAIIEDDQLAELLVDRPDARRMVGDIYLGRVEAVLPGIQAAFVDIGTEKSAFLHASDLVYPEDEHDGDHDDDADEDADEHGGGRRQRTKAPTIQDVLKRGQDLVVQVSKEPISTKGPRVTAQVSLAGRFLVFMPFAERVGVSRKIGDREARKRLRAQVEEVLPKDSGGVIVRTVGEDVTKETLERELTTLIGQWKRIKRKTHFVRAPNLIHRETSLTRGLMRDVFSTKVEQLTVDSKQVYNEILEYLKGIAPELVDRIKLYEEVTPLF